LALWNFADWLASWAGGTVGGRLLPLDILAAAAGIYFHFQLFTDFAAIAAARQPQGEDLDRRFLQWRTIHTLFLTAVNIMSYLPARFQNNYIALILVFAGIAAAVCLAACVFSLRKLVYSSSAMQE